MESVKNIKKKEVKIMIKFQNVALSYQKNTVLEDVSFSLERGEFVYLIGENGAGKSTLVQLLCKELKPNSGEIYMFGKSIKKARDTRLKRRMGIVFQDHSKYLLGNKTVYENLSYALESLGTNPFKIRPKVMDALDMLGLTEHEKKMPYELSGGQKQCLSIARAIVTNPKLLICDEPTANLSVENRDMVMGYLQEINQKGTTVLLITHDHEILANKKESHRVLHVKDGRINEEWIEVKDIMLSDADMEIYHGIIDDIKGKNRGE